MVMHFRGDSRSLVLDFQRCRSILIHLSSSQMVKLLSGFCISLNNFAVILSYCTLILLLKIGVYWICSTTVCSEFCFLVSSYSHNFRWSKCAEKNVYILEHIIRYMKIAHRRNIHVLVYIFWLDYVTYMCGEGIWLTSWN